MVNSRQDKMTRTKEEKNIQKNREVKYYENE